MNQIDLWGNQYHFVADACQFTALLGGIGSGKSLGGAAKAAAAGLGNIGGKAIPTPNLGMFTAPTYSMLRDATLRSFQEVARPFIADFNKSDGVITLINGSEILLRSADEPERLRGPNLSWWWGDEAALYGASVWKIMIGRLRQFGKLGWAWITTTPKGRNWIWQRFVQTATAAHRIYKVRTRDNPFVDRAFVEALEADYVGDFADQELSGEFVAHKGLIYPEFNRDIHGTAQVMARPAMVAAGVDWGFVHPGVIQVGGVGADTEKQLLHEEYARRRSIDDWIVFAKELRDIYEIRRFYCDPSEPDYIRKFNDAGLNAEAADNTVSTGIQLVRKHLARSHGTKRGLMVHSSCVNTLSEFDQYQWAETRDGDLREEPVKANDHAMDALRYALMGLERQGRRGHVTIGQEHHA